MSDTLVQTLDPEVTESYDRLRADCGRVDLPDIAVIQLLGDDRKGWLQGQVTNDLRQLDLGASFSFSVCEATGQIVSVCEVWSLPGKFFITCPKGTLQALLKRFEQMVILEDVQASDVTGDYYLASIQGPTATASLTELMELPKLDAGPAILEGSEVFCLRSDRTGLGGWDVLIPLDAKKAIKKIEKTFERILPQAYEIARIEAGFPKYGSDIDVKTLPPELGPAFETRTISYTKGCYMGQEVLMRMHSRGHANRRWVGLMADQALPEGAAVKHPRRADAGKVTSSAVSPDFGFIGAAMLRREIAEEGEVVQVETPGGLVEAEVRLMPILRLD